MDLTRQMKSLRNLTYLFTTLLFVGCNHGRPLNDYGKNFAEIMRSTDGMFRGIDLGKSKREVMEKEKGAKPKDEDVNYLYYEFPGDTGELYTLEYQFDEQGLNQVRLDAYYPGVADAHTLFLSFYDYYKDKYGETEKMEGFAAWAFKRPDGKKLQIELTDESAEYRQGKFSLLIYYLPEEPGAKDVPKK
ncbi:MAG TPA: hypothetical protein VI112_10190 [Bacteroidia bacterium]|jgi:hypothetical protein